MILLGKEAVVALWVLVVLCVYHCCVTLSKSSVKGLSGEGSLAVITCAATLYLLYLLLRNGVSEQVTLGEAGELALWLVVLVNLFRCATMLQKTGLSGHGVVCLVSCLASLYLLYNLLMNSGL
jgi:hypothetical protein